MGGARDACATPAACDIFVVQKDASVAVGCQCAACSGMSRVLQAQGQEGTRAPDHDVQLAVLGEVQSTTIIAWNDAPQTVQPLIIGGKAQMPTSRTCRERSSCHTGRSYWLLHHSPARYTARAAW